mmetsp:Transcript_9453/g.10437  ORF Transcript_9453/g.10437 Transcript_9453/m.10437 type:complete len:369 (-) Transcript_9453:79-1185(-)|eukprot:CAMPEP_0168509730 /NCGR_PEP_ID=MMETSP0405-20121227/974_1 /TAXON_ID=498012 /ORGANISM="Trichosphaerium sp, Strain Am-I-7 wt" /LENGTH=368 /DNA_ID=CAMNT_0008527293 /DNA_START=42 /DNA_END=1148 /DNA_ORIENTATION=-
MSEKPRVLILGGVGFVGRNLVTYLVKNNLASRICVADKVLPQTAGLSAEELKTYESEMVTFKQASLAKDAHIEKVFAHDGGNWKYVINLAAVTKYSQPFEVYKENIIELSQKCAAAAKANGAARYVEVSTAQVYDAGKKPSVETSSLKPWTQQAKASLEAENSVKACSGLNYVIVRPAIIYGPGDTSGITPRIIAAATYKKRNKPMEFLWTKTLKINTVHVRDVATAVFFLCEKGESGAVYNLADKSETDQGSINKVLEEIFGIKTGFKGTLMSKTATTVSMKTVAEVANDKHLKPWSELCKDKGVLDTPLTPYLDEELLYNNGLSVDGSAIEKLGFKYSEPKLNAGLIREVITDFEAKGYFPKGVAS